jgi:hypothetical protein
VAQEQRTYDLNNVDARSELLHRQRIYGPAVISNPQYDANQFLKIADMIIGAKTAPFSDNRQTAIDFAAGLFRSAQRL